MKTSRFQSVEKYLPPAVLAVTLLAAYLRTLAPGLSWANGGSDGGDLIAAAATGGVPHPTGYPLYLILARAFQLLPLGSLAFRTNLMSALAGALAAVIVYAIVSRDRSGGRAAGMLSGYAFGLAPLVWSQAVITEVYSLQALLVALVLYLYSRPEDVTPARLDLWRGLALGLALSNHVTALLLVPAALLAGSVRESAQSSPGAKGSRFAGLRFDVAALLRQWAGCAAGLSLYLLLPLRALANPPVNWGNVVTPARFWWLVSAQLYQSYYLEFSLEGALARLGPLAALFLRQFGLPVVLLGLIGLLFFQKGSRLYRLTAWTALIFTLFALLYSSADSYVYLIPMVLCFAVWAGLGAEWIARRIPSYWLVLAVLVYFALWSVDNIAEVDASRDRRAETFIRDVLAAAPQQAIVFAKGDEAVFSLWYAHFALARRPDLAVLAEDLLHFDWYQENLRATYPSLVVPAPFPWPQTVEAANPSRRVCYVEYEDEAEIECP